MAYSKNILEADFLAKYENIASKTLQSGLIFDNFTTKVKEFFDDWDIKSEDQAAIVLETFGNVAIQYNKDALAAAKELINLEYSTGLTEEQGALTDSQKTTTVKQGEVYDRQKDGYDDNILVKAAEFKGGLANFAVNANSDSAQTTISAFNSSITALTDRVQ